MALTAKEVQGHFYNMLRQSPLAAEISGPSVQTSRGTKPCSRSKT